ncbi:MAG: ribosome maturation factor RimM [Gammaproteobacteria bacterium]|nr:ribosome maturation factor RimM [Gammaproteobacteria bacterium]NIM72816.1 ribosome maturation factor RimM [Gammaproteobacteria bacterium]NIN38274.1 ribosome maturation factor RimM [Gammaproteobacteria bacterium]NIO24564.1 ribosome maturation factor RimM [Gammaproteobacteria bacterium]NIO65173.1 ribosome maturation factor RimM [Gammaproteobacteria bacterium]
MPQRVTMGRVSGVYGVRGWLRVRSDCEPAEGLLGYSPWQLKTAGGWRSHALEGGRAHGSGLVAKLAEVDDRDQARTLVGADIAVDRSQLAPLADDEYYWSDLIGLEVVTREGTSLGRVTGLMETGANDVLVLSGDRERLVPFIRDQVVVRVDREAGRIEVDWDPDF